MHPDLKKIEEAASGLLFLSESEYPFTIFQLEEGNVESRLRELSGKPDAKMETVTAEYFFRNMVKVYPGYSKEQTETARRFAELQNRIHEILTSPAVYRIGSVQVDVFITGKLSDGRYGGLRTMVVET